MQREWFLAHKQEFDEGYSQPMKALLSEVHAAIDGSFPHCDLDEARVFRIFRDVRFSKDKSPYKTHIGGHISVVRSGKKGTEVPIALYLHVGQPKSFAGAGFYMMDADALRGFRAAVADDARGKELDKILASLRKKGFELMSHDMYKRVPAGFDPDHPRAEHLRRKGLIAMFPEMPKGILASKKLVPWLCQHAKTAAPLVEWLVYATA